MMPRLRIFAVSYFPMLPPVLSKMFQQYSVHSHSPAALAKQESPEESLSFTISGVQDPQSVQCQKLLYLFYGPRLWCDQPGKSSGGDDKRLFTAFRLHPGDNLVNQSDVPVVDPGLHRVDGIFGDNMGGLDYFDPRQLARLLEQRLHRDHQPRRNCPAAVLALLVNVVKGGRRPEIDNDQRAPVLLVPGHGIDNTICTYFSGVVVMDRHAGLYSGADGIGLKAEILQGKILQNSGQGRHDRRDDDAVHTPERNAGEPEKIVDQNPVLVSCPGLLGGDAPILQKAFSIVNAEHYVAVPHIYYQQQSSLLSNYDYVSGENLLAVFKDQGPVFVYPPDPAAP